MYKSLLLLSKYIVLREEISKWRLSHHKVWENVTGIFDVFRSTPHSRDVTDIIENVELAHRQYSIHISCSIDVDTIIEYFCTMCINLETTFWEIQKQNFQNFEFFWKKSTVSRVTASSQQKHERQFPRFHDFESWREKFLENLNNGERGGEGFDERVSCVVDWYVRSSLSESVLW